MNMCALNKLLYFSKKFGNNFFKLENYESIMSSNNYSVLIKSAQKNLECPQNRMKNFFDY